MARHGIGRQAAGRWGAGLCLLIAAFLAVAAVAEEFDPGKSTGPEIQAYRDNYVPHEYPSPARTWYYADAVVVTVLLLSGMWLVRTNRPARWITIQMGVALLYLGIFRGGCICPVGATANVCLGIVRPELIGLSTLVLFLVPLIVALLCGRIFCGSVCPLGAVQALCSPDKARHPVPRRPHLVLLGVPVLVLLATAATAGSRFLPCLLDPYTPLFFQGHALVQKAASWFSAGYAEPGWILAGSGPAWAILAAALAVGWFIPRAFCRYLCPYGVLLGLLSIVAFRRRKIDPAACIQCERCATHCPVQAIRPAADGTALEISAYQCIQCNRCSSVCKKRAV